MGRLLQDPQQLLNRRNQMTAAGRQETTTMRMGRPACSHPLHDYADPWMLTICR